MQSQTRWGIPPSPTMANRILVRVLADSILAGEATVEEIFARCSHTLDRNWPWMRILARRYVRAFAGRTRPRRRDVVGFLLRDRGFQKAWSRYSAELSVRKWMVGTHRMQPVAAAASWDVPAIESVGALAEWLALSINELEWFADLRGLGYKNSIEKLQHYRYRILAKRFAGIRLVEAPKQRLKEAQGKILAGILERIPCFPAVHGFVKGRSIRSFAAPHVGQQVVLRMDLQDFFPSISGARVQALFRTAGYPEPVADLLGGICTNATPRSIWNGGVFTDAGACRQGDRAEVQDAIMLYARPHLPQGAPTSPALANLCAYRADCRLRGLARSIGAEYTRYADDLAFSGGEGFARCAERFATHAAAILMEEGFRVHHRKTRIMRQSVRQQLAGVVVNQRINFRRSDFDRLKATLTNCMRLGPASQNRDGLEDFRAHLDGRVAFAESLNPARGKRLRDIYDRISWPQATP